MKPPVDMPEQMNKASNGGWSALAISDFKLAEKNYLQALEIARQLKDPVAESVFLGYLGMSVSGLGQKTEAHKLLNEAMQIAESLSEPRLIAHISFLFAELYASEGEETHAIAQLWKALDAALEVGDQATTEVSFAKLGEIYRNRGWLEQASECFRQAAETAPNSSNLVAWFGNLGQTLAEIGDQALAIKYYKQALAEAERSGDIVAQSRCLASEGLAYFEESRYEEAISCLNKALELARLTVDKHTESSCLGNLSNVHLKLGKLEIAEKLSAEALQLSRTTGNKRMEAAQLDTLGDCLFLEGNFDRALEHYKQAFQMALTVYDKLGERIYLANQGRALSKLGKDDEALTKFTQAAQLFEEQRGKIQSDNLKTTFAAAGQNIYQQIIELCLKAGRRVEAVEYVGRAKSRAMLDLLSNSPIDISDLQSTDDESIAKLVLKEIELKSEISNLERMFGQSDTNDSHRGVSLKVEDVPRLYGEWREVVDQLKRRHPAYASMVSVDSMSFEEIRSLWKGNTSTINKSQAIFEFFWTDSYLLVAGIWDGLAQPEINIISGDDLNELESDLFDFLEMSSTELWTVPKSLCQRLYEKLMAPLLSQLPDTIKNLLVVPHGYLHKLPFAALFDGEQYLIERYAISVLPSVSIIKLLAQSTSLKTMQKMDSQYLVSAISDYSATRSDGVAFSARLRSSAGLEDLEHTLEEGQNIFDLVSVLSDKAKLLTNKDVKDGLVAQFADYSVIHFAGHAIFNPEEPLASGLVLADGSVLTAARILEDGKFRTQCGRLLVLSACQTGVNVISTGGEIIGLARALIFAGMPNLVLSLWEVADLSTAELMQNFHSLWQDGKISIAQALKEAQCKAIKAGQPVHAWAPFIHMGVD